MIEETLADVLADALAAHQERIWTSLPARVVSYDAATQRAVVEITVIDADGALPVLPSVPVSFPRSGSYAITWPIAAGDAGMVLFPTLGADMWLATGQPSAPSDPRRHSVTSGVFIPGVHPSPAATAPTDVIRIGHTGHTADFVALAGKVDTILAALNAAMIAGASAGGVATGAALVAAWTAFYSAGSVPPPPASAAPLPSVAAADVKVT